MAVLDSPSSIVRSALTRDQRIQVLDVPSLSEAEAVVRRDRPNALVLVFDEPQSAEVVRLRALHRKHAGLRTLIVSHPIADLWVTRLLKAGAGGLLFSSDVTLLPTAVRELVRGGAPMSNAVSRLVLDRARRSSAKMAAVFPRTPAAQALLTPRQRDILALLAKGLSYDEVGTALGLSLNTIRAHVRLLYERLGATTKVEAVMLGIELGLLEKFVP